MLQLTVRLDLRDVLYNRAGQVSAVQALVCSNGGILCAGVLLRPVNQSISQISRPSKAKKGRCSEALFKARLTLQYWKVLLQYSPEVWEAFVPRADERNAVVCDSPPLLQRLLLGNASCSFKLFLNGHLIVAPVQKEIPQFHQSNVHKHLPYHGLALRIRQIVSSDDRLRTKCNSVYVGETGPRSDHPEDGPVVYPANAIDSRLRGD